MGFRCPVCKEDFGIDKKTWENHCKKSHDGIAIDLINILKKYTEKKNIEDNPNLLKETK